MGLINYCWILIKFCVQRIAFGHNLIILILIIEKLNLICIKQIEMFDILGKNVTMGIVLPQMFASAKVDLAGRIAPNVRKSKYIYLFLSFSFVFQFGILNYIVSAEIFLSVFLGRD